MANEVCNYGEYSGDPTESLTFEYAKTIHSLMTKGEPVQGGKVRARYLDHRIHAG
jgi:ATP citrate (pro-S)-lyase